MKDQELVSALRYLCPGNFTCARCEYEPVCHGDGCAIIQKAADRIANQSTHIAALQQEIEKLRGQNKQLREAAALVTKESAELLERRWIPVTERLPELQSWGASEVVLGLIKSENVPSLNKLHNLTLCVYCVNGIWSMPGRYVAITPWMPLPEPPEV